MEFLPDLHRFQDADTVRALTQCMGLGNLVAISSIADDKSTQPRDAATTTTSSCTNDDAARTAHQDEKHGLLREVTLAPDSRQKDEDSSSCPSVPDSASDERKDHPEQMMMDGSSRAEDEEDDSVCTPVRQEHEAPSAGLVASVDSPTTFSSEQNHDEETVVPSPTSVTTTDLWRLPKHIPDKTNKPALVLFAHYEELAQLHLQLQQHREPVQILVEEGEDCSIGDKNRKCVAVEQPLNRAISSKTEERLRLPSLSDDDELGERTTKDSTALLRKAWKSFPEKDEKGFLIFPRALQRETSRIRERVETLRSRRRRRAQEEELATLSILAGAGAAVDDDDKLPDDHYYFM